MPIDFQSICKDNLRRRGEEFDDIGQFVAERLYSDQTHFVYELLQNAEDALRRRESQQPNCRFPRSVSFRLSESCLEVSHYGQPFDEDDVRGVSDILKGTKQQDASLIGTFGIGFKSVYAFTATPEIHSDDAHFCIERYIRLREVELHPLNQGETLFIFPFDHKKVAAQDSFERIGDRLRSLGARTLLFLRHIDKVEWSINGCASGTYSRDSRDEGEVRFIRLYSETQAGLNDENWLVFQREVALPADTGTGRVEIAFKLQEDDEGSKSIECLSKSCLNVFFPTVLDTKLGFLIQGPYETTSSRDNIKRLSDSEWNCLLVNETAELLGDSLNHLKLLDLLQVESLQSLPIRMRNKSTYSWEEAKWVSDYPEDWIFWPLHKRTMEAFIQDDLLLCANGGYVSASRAKLARGRELRNLISEDQLSTLSGSEKKSKWLSELITQDRYPEVREYLIHILEVEEITPTSFVRKLTKEFLEIQSDKWFIEFYKFLNSQPALWKENGVLLNKPFLRLDDDSLTELWEKGYCAYIPPETPTDLPIVKRCIASEAKAFLINLGMKEPDVYDDAIEHILTKYTGPELPVNRDVYEQDLIRVMTLLEKDSEIGKAKLKAQATDTPIVLCQIGEIHEMRKPSQSYLRTDILLEYFTDFAVPFIDEEIYSLTSIDNWKFLGCIELPQKICTNYIPFETWEYSARSQQQVLNHDLIGLKEFLNRLAREKDIDRQLHLSLLLWKIIEAKYESDHRLFYGLFEWFYYKTKRKQFDNQILECLKSAKWLPTTNRGLCAPNDVTKDELTEVVAENLDLLRVLGIKEQKVSQIKDELIERGISNEEADEVVEAFNKDPQGAARSIIEHLRSKKNSSEVKTPTFPTYNSSNPERRAEGVAIEFEQANKKEYDLRNRSVRTSSPGVDPKVWLRELYTNEDNIMVCQICKQAMPFKLRDGQDYFEAVQVWDDADKEVRQLYIALCPLCAAKYKHLTKTNECTITLLKNLLSMSDGELSVEFDMYGQEKQTLCFVEIHLNDLKTILNQYHKIQ